MLHKTSGIFTVGALLLCLLIAGCGGGEEQISKADFVQRAGAICQNASGKLAAEVRSIASRESAKPGRSRTDIQVALVKGTLIPGLSTELEEIRALGIPDEDGTEVKAFFKASQGVIEEAEANPEDFAGAASPYEAAELAGRRIGLTTCPIAPVTAG